MAIKVPGSLGGLQIIKETSYGLTPLSANPAYIGFMRSMDAKNSNSPDELGEDGRRGYGEVLFGAQEASLSTELSLFRDSGTYTWTRVLELAMGALTGFQEDLPSFTSIMKIARDQYSMMTGCKVNKLTLSAEGVGQKVTGKMECVCMQLLPEQASYSGCGLTGTEDAGPAEKNSITYIKYPTTTIPGAAEIPSTKFSIGISHSLESQEGIVNDTPLKAGCGSIPGKSEISLSYEVKSVSSFWDDLKLHRTKGFSVSQTIGGYRLTFKDCYLPGDDLPSRSQSTYPESIGIRASDMTVEKVVP